MIDACDFLSIEKPVLQGAMGAVARHDLVVAVSKGGGLGTLSYLPPEAFRKELAQIEDSLEGRAFAANLLMPIISKAHVEACLQSDVPIVSIFYGFSKAIVSALKDANKKVLFQVGSVDEAKLVVAKGADGVIVQGHEAGGHIRGTERLAILLPKVREALPNHLVIGAGGIHDAESAAACRSLGADAVCSGTRFLASPESAAHPSYKQRLISDSSTIVTRLFGVGWRDSHRVMANAATRKWLREDGNEPALLPAVHAVTRVLSRLAGGDGGAALTARQVLSRPLYTPSCLTVEMNEALLEVVALYAGECVREVRELQSAATTVARLSG